MSETDASAALLAVTQADRDDHDRALNDLLAMSPAERLAMGLRRDDMAGNAASYLAIARHRLSATRADEPPVEVGEADVADAAKRFCVVLWGRERPKHETPVWDQCIALEAALAHPPAANPNCTDAPDPNRSGSAVSDFAGRSVDAVACMDYDDQPQDDDTFDEKPPAAVEDDCHDARYDFAGEVRPQINGTPVNGDNAAICRECGARLPHIGECLERTIAAAPDPSTPGEVGHPSDVERLREALKPFAEAAEPIIHNDERWDPDAWILRCKRNLNVGHYRAAHAALLAAQPDREPQP